MKIGGNCSVSGSVVPATRAWHVEKPSRSDNPRGDSRRRTLTARTGTPLRTSSNEARIIDAEQQLLQATFVAQVLGQILEATPDKRSSAVRAYALRNRKNAYSQFAEVA